MKTQDCEVYIYHVQHPDTEQKIATVAIQKRGRIWCRGVAVVSPRDQFRLRDGRVKAAGLVEAAFYHGCHVKPFGPRDPAHPNAGRTDDYNYHFVFADNGLEQAREALRNQPMYRSQYNVSLTAYELNTVLPRSVADQYRQEHQGRVSQARR